MNLNEYGHGPGCLCTGSKYEDRYTCPWFSPEVDIETIPQTLEGCYVCHAVVIYGRHRDHMEWHVEQGHIS